jgi:hypothetical protein
MFFICTLYYTVYRINIDIQSDIWDVIRMLLKTEST